MRRVRGDLMEGMVSSTIPLLERSNYFASSWLDISMCVRTLCVPCRFSEYLACV